MTATAGPALGVVAFATRERARTLLQRLPRRRVHVTLTAELAAFRTALRAAVVDAVIVELGPGEAPWHAAALAAELGSAPWFGLASWRAADAPAVDRAARVGLVDVLAEGVDDAALLPIVARDAFTTRFAQAFAEPPAVIRLATPLQLKTWRLIVAAGGRPVTTATLAADLGVSREHLSRAFSADGAPNLKRVIDLVRLLAAATLAKNPLYDTGDVARVLDFASASHLATTTRRVVGLTPASLSRLRAGELAEHFARGHSRSRG